MQKIVLLLIGSIIVVGIVFIFTRGEGVRQSAVTESTSQVSESENKSEQFQRRVELSTYSDIYRFSAELSDSWQVEFVSQTQALNIFDPSLKGINNLEKSQIFIRNFEASRFLTLSSVNIHSQESTQIKGHQAVRYDITKKPGVANFPNQPTWRSSRHKVIDIRLTDNNPSFFYVFAANPLLSQEVFDQFFQSLKFHNDQESFQAPLEQAQARITKKPFGIQVSPQNSPVQPERFSGFHTGLDFEILSREESADVNVKAICGGQLQRKQQASGYGGVIVQECLLANQVVTVLYGHLRLSSIAKQIGEYLAPGEVIGMLGDGESVETDGQRKHLHLSVHKGSNINLLGYVSVEAELAEWINPVFVLVEDIQ